MTVKLSGTQMAVPRLRRSRRGGRQVFGLQDQVRLGKRKHTASRLGSATTMARRLYNKIELHLVHADGGYVARLDEVPSLLPAMIGGNVRGLDEFFANCTQTSVLGFLSQRS